MTLVIAQRIGSRINLSSDSRISFGKDTIDYGIKIFSVPVKIYSPTISETGVTELVYDHNLGLAVVGSTTNAYTVKEAVYEILQHLQFIPGYTDFSLYGIAKLVFKIYCKAAKDIGAIFREKGICELILTGYCPKENGLKVFKFSTDPCNFYKPYSFEEILLSDGVEFFGSGAESGEEVFQNNITFNPLQIIRKVIQDGVCTSVGGGLQFGDFNENLDFRVCGVQYYSLNEDGTFNEYLNTLRGINWYKDEFERDEDGFHIAYTFITPFQREIDDLWRNHLE